MRTPGLPAILLLTFFCAASAGAIDISQQWCGGDCSEGHDNTACVCTYNAWMDPSTEEAWVSCEEFPCCVLQSEYCDLGYTPDEECYFEYYEPEICVVNTPRGARSCEVGCGDSGCWAPYANVHYETEVNEQGSNYCTRSNETCRWAQFWEFPWCLADCTLAAQSPWDDVGSGLVCGPQ